MSKTNLDQPAGDRPQQTKPTAAQNLAARAMWFGIFSPLFAPILAPYAIAHGLRARSALIAQGETNGRPKATLAISLGVFWLLVVVLSAVVPPSGAFTVARLAVILLHVLLVGAIFNRLEKVTSAHQA